MSTYVIGDVQGCFDELQSLLRRCRFDPARDRVWLVGDLVNRGPRSLEVLRWARDRGDACVAVLGNHDLHLLAVAYAGARIHKSDTLQDVLDAPDREELLDWLRSRPLFHREGAWAMVHAGLWPEWSLEQAEALAREVETELRGADCRRFFEAMYGNQPDRWHEDLAGMERLRFTVNVMTRLRMLASDGRIELKYSGELEEAPTGLRPWFEARAGEEGCTVLFGHWSALGLRFRADVVALDSGCVWGNLLTAYRLEDGAVFQQPSFQPKRFE